MKAEKLRGSGVEKVLCSPVNSHLLTLMGILATG